MNKKQKRSTRHLRVRKKVNGTIKTPRLSIFRSNKNIYGQIIDDQDARTLISLSSQAISRAKKSDSGEEGKLKQASTVGENLAKAALKKNIKKVVFDRGGFKYHGRVKALAEGARKGGLKF